MSLSESIDRVHPWCTGWEKSSGRKSLLVVAQQVLDSIYSIDHDSLIFRPGNTSGNSGFPPYLLTTAGTFKYALDAAHLSCGSAIYHESSGNTVPFIPRKIRRVMVDITNVGYFPDMFYGQEISSPASDPYGMYGYNNARSRFLEVKVSSAPAMTSNSGTFIPPTVTFINDPGTQLTKYFVEFYVMPQRLMGVNSEIPLPIEFESDFEDGIRGRVQTLESGVPSPMYANFKNVSIPEIRSAILTTATIQGTATPPNYV